MLHYQPATPDQIEEFLRLMQSDTSDYLERTLQLMDMTWLQFSQVVRSVGQVISIHRDQELVGFYWVEERDRVLHLHGLMIRESYQSQGIGTEVLNMLAREYAGMMDAIELGVHESNTRARALYAKLGYQTVNHLANYGFYVLQRPLREE